MRDAEKYVTNIIRHHMMQHANNHQTPKLSFIALSSILMLLFQVCPLCAANLGKDVIGHFTLQHAHSLKVLFTGFASSGC